MSQAPAPNTGLHLTFAGQAHDSIGRVLIQTSCYEKFCNRLKDRVSKLRVGDPMDHSNDMGATLTSNISAVKSALELQSHIKTFKVGGGMGRYGGWGGIESGGPGTCKLL